MIEYTAMAENIPLSEDLTWENGLPHISAKVIEDMGVRGLGAFLEHCCPQACYEVNIRDLAQLSKCKNDDAKMVVDAQSCYTLWYQDLDWKIGIEIHELIERLRDFVESFRNFGVQLIFFFDGLTSKVKRRTWIERRRKMCERYYMVFDRMNNGRRGNVDLLPKKFLNPVDMGLFSSYILKHILKCQVRMSINECVEDIVEYVHQQNCFAIFSQNTDFLVRQINDAIFLSAKNFNVKTMTTLQYDREKLAHHLGIGLDKMPLLALVAGNDVLQLNSSIKAFYRRLCGINAPSGSKSQLEKFIPAIGNYINRLPNYMPIEEILKQIAKDLLGDSSRSKLLETIYESYYSIRKTQIDVSPEDEWFRILSVARARHRTVEVPNSIYSIMTDRIFEWDCVFEDLRIRLDQNSSTVTQQLRRRLYGILLYEKPGAPIEMREWCADHLTGYLRPTVVKLIPPIVRHPGLLALWSDNNDDSIIGTRWSLFFTSIRPVLTQERSHQKFQAIDSEDLFSCLSAYYLFKKNFLNVFELNAVLATIATHRLHQQRRAHLLKYTLDLRASQISITFLRTYGLILTLLAACGYPIELTPDNVIPKFEGKLFQLKYAEVMENKRSYTFDALCENYKDCIDSFYKMRKFIMEKSGPAERR